MTKLQHTKKRTFKLRLFGLVVSFILIIISGYYMAVYSNHPFISKWRTIYIETAMSTMTHQWLATYFIPENIINEVISQRQVNFEENLIDTSKIVDNAEPTYSILREKAEDISLYTEEYLQERMFKEIFYEIDINTVPDNFDFGNTQISDCIDLGIKTTAGDSIWAIDIPNQLMIIEVKRNSYVAKLAIVKDSECIKLHTNTRDSRGSTILEHMDESNALLAINASGFADYNGQGNGATPVGLVKYNGIKINEQTNLSYYQIAGFDSDNNFIVGDNVDTSILRDAVEFYPLLISDGEIRVSGSYGLGLHPRSAIGQTIDKATLLLVVDGRQVGYSLGATVSECAELMQQYGAQNAMCLDGGSSSVMAYQGKLITSSSSPMQDGRYLPNSWVVMPRVVTDIA